MTVKTLGKDLDVIKEVKEIHTLTLIIGDLRAEVNQLRNKEIHSEVEQDEQGLERKLLNVENVTKSTSLRKT